MVNGITSGFSSASVFSQRQTAPIKYDHDHTPEGCLSCQPNSGKAKEVSGPTSGKSSTKEDQSVNKANAASSPSSAGELTAEEKKEVAELQKRDQEVRQHEQAHLAAAGAHAKGGPSFTYQKGPDGKMYAVGGEVPVDVSPVADNPQATIQKAEAVQRAALAPADPSGPDRQVAAKAAAMAISARQELAQQSQESASVGKKVSQNSSPSRAQENFSSRSETYFQADSSTVSSAFFSSYFQQKQIHNARQSGSVLNIYA